jgi:hypothetical protein
MVETGLPPLPATTLWPAAIHGVVSQHGKAARTGWRAFQSLEQIREVRVLSSSEKPSARKTSPSTMDKRRFCLATSICLAACACAVGVKDLEGQPLSARSPNSVLRWMSGLFQERQFSRGERQIPRPPANLTIESDVRSGRQ